MLDFILKRIRSFRYAIQGIFDLFLSQGNAQVHLLAVVVIVGLGLYLGLSAVEWGLILICMALVLSLEAMNTAVEYIVDLVSPELHPLAGKAKDVAAAAVLLAVMVCGVVWGIIFLPKIALLLGSIKWLTFIK